eukprot:TRINITY_DN3770_c0_g1_i1.p1 TRINITY_DN3770_c0_g1~~TRINITY_DN3770_c0_g1_i1.p1  ORF type:complete len:129 (+),score=14.69 TRINITY_DN3770_c0_g1_i1:263-649(+)
MSENSRKILQHASSENDINQPNVSTHSSLPTSLYEQLKSSRFRRTQSDPSPSNSSAKKVTLLDHFGRSTANTEGIPLLRSQSDVSQSPPLTKRQQNNSGAKKSWKKIFSSPANIFSQNPSKNTLCAEC